MPIPKKYQVDFEFDRVYHVYNRTNHKELLFRSDWNYQYFLDRADYFLSDYMEFLSWNLLPNHFHFAVKIKSIHDISRAIVQRDLKDVTLVEKQFLDGVVNESVLIENAFKRLFQSYTISFNNVYRRKGNLFYKNFKRVLVESDSQFTQLLVYINANALKHGIQKNLKNHKWSSFHDLLHDEKTNISRDLVFNWFGGKEQTIHAITTMAHYYYNSDVSIED